MNRFLPPTVTARLFNKTTLSLLYGVLLSILVFISALFLPIHPVIGRFLKYGTGFTAIALILVFWFLLSRTDKRLPHFGLVATLLLFTIPLAWSWQSDSADWGIIGGLIPVSDASIYTMDAARLIEGASFSPISSYRPMTNGFLATLLKLAGGDYKLTIAILVFLAALSIYALVREVQSTRGALVASVTLVVMFLFYRIYIGKALTESLGVIFASLAFSSLIRGARKKEMSRVLFGLGMFTMAMNIRAGAYLAIPALLVWAAYIFRERWLFSKRVLSAGVVIILVAFGLNSIVLRSIGSKNVIPFANYSDSFYGIASGYQGWRSADKAHPGATPVEKYQYAFQLIKEQPGLLVRGIVLAYVDFFDPGSYNIFSFMNFHVKEGGNLYRGYPGAENSLVYIPLFVLGGIGAYHCFKRRGWWQGMILMGWLGMVASVPFVPPIDAGIRPYAVTIPLVGFLLGEGLLQIVKWSRLPASDDTARPDSQEWPLVLSLLLIPLVFLGPIWVKGTAKPVIPPAALACPQGESYLLLKSSKNARIDVVADTTPGPVRRPDITAALYKDNIQRQRLPAELIGPLSGLSAGQSMQFMIDLGNLEQNLKPVLLVADTQTLAGDDLVFQTCAVQMADTSMGKFYHASQIFPVQRGQ